MGKHQRRKKKCNEGRNVAEFIEGKETRGCYREKRQPPMYVTWKPPWEAICDKRFKQREAKEMYLCNDER